MSDRGSFVTQFMYCRDCLKAAETVLATQQDQRLSGYRVPSWQGGDPMPIIAGKVAGDYVNEECVYFETDLIPRLSALVCHPVRVAVLAEGGEHIFTARPAIDAPRQDER